MHGSVHREGEKKKGKNMAEGGVCRCRAGEEVHLLVILLRI